MNEFHIPVLVNEVIELLAVRPGGKFIDATVGGGGHSQAIIAAGGTVLGIDRDPEAVEAAKQRLHPTHAQVVTGNFTDLTAIAAAHGWDKADGILLDLGVSSHQLDTAGRGFSFQADALLDMRMDPELNVTAADLVNALGHKELFHLFTKLGDEHLAKPIAEAIIAARKTQPFTTTGQLADLVEKIYGHRPGHLHPATKVFQALRIAVNDELNNLKAVLPQAVALLKPQGRLVIISFHEGEDRIVKQFFKEKDGSDLELLTKKPLTASSAEVARNPRARSAKLRAAQKI